MFALLITSARRIRQTTVLSTTTVRTMSPRSAVSPPVDTMLSPCLRICAKTDSVPWIRALITGPGMSPLFLPIVLERSILFVAPTQSKSSVFITTASWATPRHTLISPVSRQYMYARADLVPAPSACITTQYFSSPPRNPEQFCKRAREQALVDAADGRVHVLLSADTPLVVLETGRGAHFPRSTTWSGRVPHWGPSRLESFDSFFLSKHFADPRDPPTRKRVLRGASAAVASQGSGELVVDYRCRRQQTGAVFRQIFEKLGTQRAKRTESIRVAPHPHAHTETDLTHDATQQTRRTGDTLTRRTRPAYQSNYRFQTTDRYQRQVEALASADEGTTAVGTRRSLLVDDRGFNDTTADYVLMALSEASQLRAWDVGFTRTARSKQGATICDMVMKDWEVDLGATRGRSATTPSQGTGAPSLFSDAYIHKLFENKRRALKAQKEAIQLKEHEFKRNLFHQKRMVKKRETQRRRTIARRTRRNHSTGKRKGSAQSELAPEGRHVPSVGSGDAKVATSEHRLPAPGLRRSPTESARRRAGEGRRRQRRQAGRMGSSYNFAVVLRRLFKTSRHESRFSSAESSEKHTSGETGVYETKVQESETPLVSRPESTRQSAATPPCSAVGSQSDLAAAAEKVAEEDLKTGDGSVASNSQYRTQNQVTYRICEKRAGDTPKRRKNRRACVCNGVLDDDAREEQVR